MLSLRQRVWQVRDIATVTPVHSVIEIDSQVGRICRKFVLGAFTILLGINYAEAKTGFM